MLAGVLPSTLWELPLMKRSILAALTASVLVLSGCGSNEDEEAKTAISDYFQQQQQTAGGQQAPAMKKKDAECLADGMVDGIGVDHLKDYKILNEDNSFNKKVSNFEMSQDDAEVMADSFLDCTDTMKQMQDQIAAGAGQSPEAKKCFEDALTREKVRSMFVANFSGDQKKAGELQGELMKCSSLVAGAPSQAPSESPAQ